MSKTVRIIALILALLLGLSAIGMIAMYVSAEACDGASASAALSAIGLDNVPYFVKIAETFAPKQL